MVDEKRKAEVKKTFGIDVFIMVDANSEDEAVGIVEMDNLVMEILKVREIDIQRGR